MLLILPCSSPFPAEFVEACLGQIVGRHEDAEPHVGVESQKPGFGKKGNPRRILQIDDEDRGTLSILLREINRFRFRFSRIRPIFWPAVPSRTAALNSGWGILTVNSIRMIASLAVRREMSPATDPLTAAPG